MIDELTAELGALVATATGLPTSIDPVRPPTIPGCFVGPPSITPDDQTSGRVLVIQWEAGALVGANQGAWAAVAVHAEHIVAAVIAHPTLGLVGSRSVLYATGGDGGDAPGYRVDVAVLVPAAALVPIVPPGPSSSGAAHLAALGLLAAAGVTLAAPSLVGAAALLAHATLTAAGATAPPPSSDGAAALVAHATLTAAGATAPGAWSPASLPGLVAWFDASDLASITAAAGKVSQWADKSPNGHHATQAVGASQPSTGVDLINGHNVLKFDGVDDYLAAPIGVIAQPFTVLFVGLKNAGAAWFSGIANNNGQVWADSSWYSNAGISPTWGPAPATPYTVQGVTVFAGAASTFHTDATQLGAAQNVGAGSQDGLTLGQTDGHYPPFAHNGDWAEYVIVAGVISAPDRAAWDAYCRTKWGRP